MKEKNYKRSCSKLNFIVIFIKFFYFLNILLVFFSLKRLLNHPLGVKKNPQKKGNSSYQENVKKIWSLL